MKILDTKRIQLRYFELEDAPFIIELLNTESWKKFIGDKNVHTIGDAKLYIQNGLRDSYQKNGYGLYMVLLQEGTPIGMCGLVRRDYLDHADIGFALLPQYEGLGYGFEAAEATLNYARENLKLSTILGITIPENKRSINLLERIGLKEIGTTKHPGSEEALLLFST